MDKKKVKEYIKKAIDALIEADKSSSSQTGYLLRMGCHRMTKV